MPGPALAAARLLGARLLSSVEVATARGLTLGDALKADYAARAAEGPDDSGPEDQFVPVSSSAIRAIGWRKDGVIIVDFIRGGTYTYDGSYELFQAFVAAPSKGGFFNAYFR